MWGAQAQLPALGPTPESLSLGDGSLGHLRAAVSWMGGGLNSCRGQSSRCQDAAEEC